MHYYFSLPNNGSVKLLGGERPSILCSVSFNYTNWQVYSPFLKATGLFGLKFSLELETNSDVFMSARKVFHKINQKS